MNRARILSSTLLAICVFVMVRPAPKSIANAAATPATRTSVRVGMWTLWHDREVKLIPAAPTHKITLRACGGCATLTFADAVVIRATGDSVLLGGAGRSGPANRVDIAAPVTLSAHGETVTIHNPVAITAHAGVLAIAVTMPVESYVERVVASESDSSDSPESLKALAVVVRSFALHENHGHADFDLCDSTHCQLLHWSANGGRWRIAHTAALSTSGETLWYRGQRALAYFSKDCGGRTASPTEIWPRARAVGYLPSQTDRFCTANTGRQWASQITRADLTAALAAHGIARPGWQHLAVARRGDSGRVVTLRLDASEVSAEDFRLAVGASLGWNQIPSTWFEENQQGDRFFFHGRGWGHGIGLCQKGAAAMAAQNLSAAEILARYFPGAQPADEASGRIWQTLARNGFVLQSLDSADAAFLPELERARTFAAQRSGLGMPQAITVRAFASTPAFRNATGAPGWVAAFTEGDWIGTQPLRTLASRHLLDSTMRHEFLHALVEQQAGPAAPLWLREGLVELWADSDAKTSVAPTIKIEALDSTLAHASSETESTVAHRAAAFYTSRLVARYGRDNALLWLRSGIPVNVAATLGER
jgi:stage II sporulation protein D